MQFSLPGTLPGAELYITHIVVRVHDKRAHLRTRCAAAHAPRRTRRCKAAGSFASVGAACMAYGLPWQGVRCRLVASRIQPGEAPHACPPHHCSVRSQVFVDGRRVCLRGARGQCACRGRSSRAHGANTRCGHRRQRHTERLQGRHRAGRHVSRSEHSRCAGHGRCDRTQAARGAGRARVVRRFCAIRPACRAGRPTARSPIRSRSAAYRSRTGPITASMARCRSTT